MNETILTVLTLTPRMRVPPTQSRSLPKGPSDGDECTHVESTPQMN
jgi:hypothetical protein